MKLLIPVFLGLCTILQAGLNKKLGESWGLTRAVVINSSVFFIVALGIFLFASLYKTSSTSLFHKEAIEGPFAWWFLIPGALGFCLVFGLPLSVSLLGSVTTFVCFIAAQLAASVAWDALIESHPVTWQKIAAVAFVLTGVWLNSRS